MTAYLLPVGAMVGIAIASGSNHPLMFIAVLGSLAAGYWMALGTGEFVKILVAESCRQRWSGTNPTLRSALRGAWAHRAHAFHPSAGDRSPFGFDVAGVVYGHQPLDCMPLARSTPTLMVGGLLAMGVLFGITLVLQVPVWIALQLDAPVPGIVFLIVSSLALSFSAFLYVQGMAAVVASVEAAAEHHHVATLVPPPGFEVLKDAALPEGQLGLAQ